MNDNTNDMYKPLSIARDELMDSLIKTANDSGLPLVVMEYVVRDFYEEVKRTAAMQCEKDKEDYEKRKDGKEKKNDDSK